MKYLPFKNKLHSEASFIQQPTVLPLKSVSVTNVMETAASSVAGGDTLPRSLGKFCLVCP